MVMSKVVPRRICVNGPSPAVNDLQANGVRFMAQAPSSSIQFGSEVYTWFMKENGRAHANRLDHMIDVIARAGFAGVQPIFSWMGDLSDPRRLADSLAAHGGLNLSAISFVLDWNLEGETEEELREAESVMNFLGNFPGALLCVVQMPRGRLIWRSGESGLSAT